MQKGERMSDETKSRISEANTGKQSWNKGKHISEATRKKLREAKVGSVPWNKGIKTGIRPWNYGTHGLSSSWNRGMTLKGNPKYAGYLKKLSISAKVRVARQRKQEKEATTPRPNNLHIHQGFWEGIKEAFGIM